MLLSSDKDIAAFSLYNGAEPTAYNISLADGTEKDKGRLRTGEGTGPAPGPCQLRVVSDKPTNYWLGVSDVTWGEVDD